MPPMPSKTPPLGWDDIVEVLQDKHFPGGTGRGRQVPAWGINTPKRDPRAILGMLESFVHAPPLAAAMQLQVYAMMHRGWLKGAFAEVPMPCDKPTRKGPAQGHLILPESRAAFPARPQNKDGERETGGWVVLAEVTPLPAQDSAVQDLG